MIQGIERSIALRRRWAHWGTLGWSAAFHLFFGVSVATGILVAAISGKTVTMAEVRVSDYVPLLALIGSMASAIGVFGGFERKWKANRITRSELDILDLRLSSGMSLDDATKALIDIVRKHDAAIVQGTHRA